MPIDFLGKATSGGAKSKQSAKIEMYIPGKEAIVKTKKEVKSTDGQVSLKKINLAESFKYYFLKRKLTFITIFVIILATGIYSYFTYFYQPKQAVVVVTPPAENLNIPVVIPPTPPPPPVSQYECDDGLDNDGDGRCDLPDSVCTDGSQPGDPGCLSALDDDESDKPNPPLLADTELAPLRGALVKFSDDQSVYLVERNGELRWVDQESVVFNNGRKISNISSSLIYTISDRLKIIRKGKNVYGKVDWDPRILTTGELAPFIN